MSLCVNVYCSSWCEPGNWVISSQTVAQIDFLLSQFYKPKVAKYTSKNLWRTKLCRSIFFSMRNKQNFVVQPLTLIPSMSKHPFPECSSYMASVILHWQSKETFTTFTFYLSITYLFENQSNVSRGMFVGLGYDIGKQAEWGIYMFL